MSPELVVKAQLSAQTKAVPGIRSLKRNGRERRLFLILVCPRKFTVGFEASETLAVEKHLLQVDHSLLVFMSLQPTWRPSASLARALASFSAVALQESIAYKNKFNDLYLVNGQLRSYSLNILANL